MGEQGMDKQKLRDLGIDVDSALERLGGNEVMLERLLKAFLVDPNYGELSEALGERDTDKAFAAVHTPLKQPGTVPGQMPDPRPADTPSSH